MKRSIIRRFALLMSAFLLASASPTFSQTINSFALQDGDWVYSEDGLIGNRLNDQGGRPGEFSSRTQTNPLQNWWWYRSNNDTREYALSNQTFGESTGNHASLSYQEPVEGTSDALQFDFHYTLMGLDADHALLHIEWTVTNRSNVTQELLFFSYFDVDLNQTAGDDTGRLHRFDPLKGRIEVSEGSTSLNFVAQFNPQRAVVRNAWEIDSFPNTLTKLTDSDPDEYNNQSSPFGPGDVTGGIQYGLVLAPNGSFSTSLYKGMNVVPEPATLLALTAGLTGLGALRRRKT